MIFYKSKETQKVSKKHKEYASATRWVFEKEDNRPILNLELEYKNLKTNNWHPSGYSYSLGFTNYFSFGRKHFFHDGPHFMFSLGCFHIWWTGDCKKECCNF